MPRLTEFTPKSLMLPADSSWPSHNQLAVLNKGQRTIGIMTDEFKDRRDKAKIRGWVKQMYRIGRNVDNPWFFFEHYFGKGFKTLFTHSEIMKLLEKLPI